MTTTVHPAAPATPATVQGARCDRPSCYAIIDHRPLRCPFCNNTRLLYVEIRDGK